MIVGEWVAWNRWKHFLSHLPIFSNHFWVFHLCPSYKLKIFNLFETNTNELTYSTWCKLRKVGYQQFIWTTHCIHVLHYWVPQTRDGGIVIVIASKEKFPEVTPGSKGSSASRPVTRRTGFGYKKGILGGSSLFGCVFVNHGQPTPSSLGAIFGPLIWRMGSQDL